MFYEKLNVQESVIRQANLELTAREEELRFLRMEVREREREREITVISWISAHMYI